MLIDYSLIHGSSGERAALFDDIVVNGVPIEDMHLFVTEVETLIEELESRIEELTSKGA